MFKKKVMIGSIMAGLLLSSGAFAGASWEAFDTVVPGFNGSAYTGTQTKASTGELAGLLLNSSGGETLDVRTNSDSGSGSWLRGVKGGNTYSLNSPHAKDTSVRLHFSTDLIDGATPITGSWRSN